MRDSVRDRAFESVLVDVLCIAGIPDCQVETQRNETGPSERPAGRRAGSDQMNKRASERHGTFAQSIGDRS